MKVVLDTNIIVADFNLKKPGFKILLEGAKSGMLEVYLPQVVLDEVFNKFRQRLEKAQSSIASELLSIAKIIENEFLSPFNDELIDRLLTEYRNRLMKIISDNQINVLDYPTTDHRFLAKKAMLTKKPFNVNETGYRDSLIWENVKSLITEINENVIATPELIFITNNHTDFMSGDVLHIDLMNELEEQELHTDSFIIYKSLQEFNDKVAKLFLTQEDVFKGRLKNNEFWDFELKDIITEYLNKEYVRSDLSAFEFHRPGDDIGEEQEVSSFLEDYEIKNLTVKKLNFDEFVVDLRIDLETELEFFVDKSDYYSSRDADYSVIDYDWNDHVMYVSRTDTIPFEVTLIVNSKLECLSIEMNKLDEIPAS